MEGERVISSRLRRGLDGAHLVYLGTLPGVATFAAVMAYGRPGSPLALLGGIVAVSVYLAVVASYTGPSASAWVALLLLLDGPAFALLAQASGGSLASFLMDGFLMDGLAIWLAIAYLALATSRPTRGQLVGTLALAVLAVGAMLYSFGPYLHQEVWGSWSKSLWLTLGLLEAVAARHFLLDRDLVVRDENRSAAFILVFLLGWIAALLVGVEITKVA